MLLRLPKIGMEMTEAVLAGWLVEDGAIVAKGEPLYEMETDKVTNEIESPAPGRLRHIAVPGVTYQVGDDVAEIVELSRSQPPSGGGRSSDGE